MTSLQGKVIAITGAASGIGLQVSLLCASRGASLALCDIQSTPLQTLATDLSSTGTNVLATTVDISSSTQVNAWITSILSHFGHLDGAANIAGTEGNPPISSIIDMTDEQWDFIIRVNLTGMMYCLRAQLRVMGKGASIVNAASMVGLVGRPGMTAYSVSKHGVVGLTRSVAREAGVRGVRVNAFAP